MMSFAVDLALGRIQIKAGSFLPPSPALGRNKEAGQCLFEGRKVAGWFRRLATLGAEGVEVIHGAGRTGQRLKTLQG